LEKKEKGFVLFVPGGKQGDEVKIKVTKVLRNVGFAEIIGQGSPKSESTQEESSEESSDSSEESDSYDSNEEEDSDEDSENFGEEYKEE
jgi:tRNA/tmRNA/rRNA uracil-C5-methylase (TrmA/RlmC/RlmD family)